MKTRIFSISLLVLVVWISSCSQDSDEGKLLSPKDFSEEIKGIVSPIIVDVRTPEEFVKGQRR